MGDSKGRAVVADSFLGTQAPSLYPHFPSRKQGRKKKKKSLWPQRDSCTSILSEDACGDSYCFPGCGLQSYFLLFYFLRPGLLLVVVPMLLWRYLRLCVHLCSLGLTCSLPISFQDVMANEVNLLPPAFWLYKQLMFHCVSPYSERLTFKGTHFATK